MSKGEANSLSCVPGNPVLGSGYSLLVDNRVAIPHLLLATTTWQRMRGLLGRRTLEAGWGMYLAPAGSIHTWGMQFALDLIFMDRALRVVRVVRDVPPWRMAWGGRRAWAVIEVAAGWLPAAAVPVGAACAVAPAVGACRN